MPHASRLARPALPSRQHLLRGHKFPSDLPSLVRLDLRTCDIPAAQQPVRYRGRGWRTTRTQQLGRYALGGSNALRVAVLHSVIYASGAVRQDQTPIAHAVFFTQVGRLTSVAISGADAPCPRVCPGAFRSHHQPADTNRGEDQQHRDKSVTYRVTVCFRVAWPSEKAGACGERPFATEATP